MKFELFDQKFWQAYSVQVHLPVSPFHNLQKSKLNTKKENVVSRPVVGQPMLAAAVGWGRSLGEIVLAAAGDWQAQNFPDPGTERTQWEVARSFPDGWPSILT